MKTDRLFSKYDAERLEEVKKCIDLAKKTSDPGTIERLWRSYTHEILETQCVFECCDFDCFNRKEIVMLQTRYFLHLFLNEPSALEQRKPEARKIGMFYLFKLLLYDVDRSKAQRYKMSYEKDLEVTRAIDEVEEYFDYDFS